MLARLGLLVAILLILTTTSAQAQSVDPSVDPTAPPITSEFEPALPTPLADLQADDAVTDGEASLTEPSAPDGAIPQASMAARSTRARILGIARGQIGQKETPPDSNRGRLMQAYTGGIEGQPWCAWFATWVWRTAGHRIPAYGYTGYVWNWGLRHRRTKPPSARPRPGDFVIFDKPGEQFAHIGIVYGVRKRNGKPIITSIEGNIGSGKVAYFGKWYNPRQSRGKSRLTVHGYVAP